MKLFANSSVLTAKPFVKLAPKWRYGATATTVLTLFAETLVNSSAIAAQISVRQIQPNQYEFVLINPTTLGEAEAKAQIAKAATSKCKGLAPVLGKYKYDANEALGGNAPSREVRAYRFTQEVACLPIARVEAIARRPILKTPQESLRVQEDIRRLSEAYFRLIANKQIDAAYSQVAAMTMGVEEETWKSGKRSFLSIAGVPIQITIAKVTVYDNPAEAPESGLYVAADYTNEYENIPIHCGYLIWFRPEGGSSFRITREETGYVTTQQLKSIPSAQLPDLKQKLRCVAP